MLSLHQASLYISLITFHLSLLNCVNLNSALDSSNTGLCTPYPCNQPPQPPSSTGYSPYGNPPPPPPSQATSPSSSQPPPSSRSHCPPVSASGCCNQPPPSTSYSPPYPYFYTPPYPYGTIGGGQNGGGQGGGGSGSGGGQGTGAAVSYYSSSVPLHVLMFVLSYAFVVL
ncbi:PREDICTED: probable calcium-binding protein CML49 [Camelina sativa]|uniref:Probable calcium-binding protein CML49 n=1 Tax=Camelina sativa TaxID=90675 RepID=A0ABM0XAF3_CAMSA|nr:PREDICTED: probable calcium-binding protein CML49 [Camelina sativa]